MLAMRLRQFWHAVNDLRDAFRTPLKLNQFYCLIVENLTSNLAIIANPSSYLRSILFPETVCFHHTGLGEKRLTLGLLNNKNSIGFNVVSKGR